MDKLKITTTISLILLVTFCEAQDAFFSNFNYSNALVNPAQSAISEDINLRLLHRSQWMNLVNPFSTSQFEGSFPLRKSVTGTKYGAIGVSFVNDRLGDGGYLSTNQFGLSFNYNFQLGGGSSYLAAGIKAGYFNGASSIDGITTGSQWNGANFDPQANLGEDLANPIVKGAEVSPALMWYQNDSLGDSKYYFGVAAFNVLQPETGMIVQGFGLPTRYTITGGAQFFASNNFSISPKLLMMMQGNQSQVVIGSDWVYHMQRTKEKKSAIALATAYRFGDSFIVGAKYLTNTIDIGVSYDMTTSKLTEGLSTTTGSLEVFLNYKIASEKKAKPFLYSIIIYDALTKNELAATARYNSLTTGEKGVIVENKSSATFDLHLKEEYAISVEKEGYTTQNLSVKNSKENEYNDTVYLERAVINFDLDMQVFDKENNEEISASVFLIDEEGNEKLLGEGNKISTSLETGVNHKLVVRSDGYDDKEFEISYDKFGTMNRPIYLNKSFIGAYLGLKIIDEDTKKEIKATVMVSDITVPSTPINSLMVMNDFAPDEYPLSMNKKFEILVTKEGYFNNSLKLEVTNDQPIKKVIELSALGVGKSIILDDLLFKTGKAELDERSYRLLDQLVDFMNQNSTLTIEIGGHTDNVGSDSYNQKLSEARAKSAVEYLVRKGITSNRLKAKGYGESSPIATNETDAGRTKNRRVEMKVTGK